MTTPSRELELARELLSYGDSLTTEEQWLSGASAALTAYRAEIEREARRSYRAVKYVLVEEKDEKNLGL